ncbi:MAG TPA: glycoside hydrolase family 18 protein [Bacteroidales bacterium]|nr:glycoside hydrolase family 18 protein [Bacteroidales bacterium]
MRYRKSLYLLPILAIILLATGKLLAQQNSVSRRFAVIAYHHGPGEIAAAYPVEKLTHIIYSFLHLDGNCLAAGTTDSISIVQLVGLKQRNPNLKIILSLGGWGGCPTCPDVFATETGRSEFSNSVKELMIKYNVDGIDLDWEYPALGSIPGYRHYPEDKQNFTMLIRSLRKALGDGYEVSFAAGGFAGYFIKSVEWTEVMPLVDRVNLMTYDYINGYSTKTGHHTPLYSTSQQKESTDYAVRFLDSLGVPLEKIVIGAAFYARTFSHVSHRNNGLYRNCKFEGFTGFRDLDEYFSRHDGFKVYWDSIAQAPYAYNPKERIFATFDDSRSVALKTNYALDKGLNGIMFWSLTGDNPQNGLIGIIYNTLNQNNGLK